MVTYEQLHEHNSKRPFSPFWVKLTSGEVIYITEPNKAVVSRQQFVFTPDRRGLRWIPLNQIDSHGRLSPTDGSSSSSTSGSGR